jgi:hypothetical protein
LDHVCCLLATALNDVDRSPNNVHTKLTERVPACLVLSAAAAPVYMDLSGPGTLATMIYHIILLAISLIETAILRLLWLGADWRLLTVDDGSRHMPLNC